MSAELNFIWSTTDGSVCVFSTLWSESGVLLGQKVFVFEKTTRDLRNERRKKLEKFV